MSRFVDLAGSRGVASDGDPATLLDRLHLLREGHPAVGAVLLSGREPQRVLPQATVRLRVARGALEETVRQVQLRLRRHADRSGLVRRERDAPPVVAVREVVVNAIAHREYRSAAPAQVRLDDEQLEVRNPGHLPEPSTVSALRRVHPSVPPNPRTARALYLAGPVEEWGTGTLRVVSSMEKRGSAAPIFECLARRDLVEALGVSLRTVQNDRVALESLGLTYLPAAAPSPRDDAGRDEVLRLQGHRARMGRGQ